MDGLRVQKYWSNEVDALLQTYKQFEILVPATNRGGAAHSGEDGRFVEDLLKEYLARFLPKGLEVLTGFILRAAVRTGDSGKERKGEKDIASTQLDIIIYDSQNYPVFQRFGSSAVVPPEGVVGIISVKKHLRVKDFVTECGALSSAAKLCRTIRSNDPRNTVRGPYLALVSMASKISKKNIAAMDLAFDKISSLYKAEDDSTYDGLVDYVGILNSWSLIKQKLARKPVKGDFAASYLGFLHRESESHLGLQYLLSGVLSVYYDGTRSSVRRPGFTAFPSDRNYDKMLGRVTCTRLR